VGAPWNYELYVDGKWVSGEGNSVIEVVDPATEAVIGQVPEATAKDARRAIEAARTAFDEGPWPWMTPKERGAALKRLAEILDERHPELHELIVAETGSTVGMTDIVQCSGSVGLVHWNAEHAQTAVEWVEASPPTGGPSGMSGSALVREPVGVVAAITPFNFPFYLNLVKVVPAMAAGCTVVLKPHPWTTLDAFEIAKAAHDAGIPPGVLNVISGGGEVGDELTGNPMVDMVTFTGSTATGRRIMANAGGTVKRLELELGGKSAQIVLDDVSEDYAASIGFGAVLVHCGQGCVIQTRLLLPERLMDAYVDGVKKAAPLVKIGDPRDPSTVLGPLIRERQRERVEGYVKSGLEEGAELLVGGGRPKGMDRGFFFEPTVFVKARNDMRIAQEEIFGPVLTVIPYSGDDEEAVRIANDSIYGLGGGVIAGNTARAFNVARRVRAGSMSAQGVDSPALTALGPGGGQGPGWGFQPGGIGTHGAFGGFKQSGVGREWGHHGLEEFTEIKSISWS
jgi:acyl-CoA reductase-like NAD-dependent aldehyde dehydrogenase